MRHIRELIKMTKVAYPRDEFFANFDETMKVLPEKRVHYQAYERALALLDSESWAVLRNKAIAHFTDHRTGQRKQGFFNQLNDAFAYQHLIRRGYDQVRVLREVGTTQPDIEYMDGSKKSFCEVKTIGISEELIARRQAVQVHNSSIYYELSPEFLGKFCKALDIADGQIKARGAKGLIYLVIHFDDFTLEYYKTYRRQIMACLSAHAAENVYVKIGILGRKHISKGSTRAQKQAPNSSLSDDAPPQS
ncbi:MAG TPA: hypothetical protein VIE69_04110 [Methylophilaceae bacterium]|jgi:hypothetical protein